MLILRHLFITRYADYAFAVTLLMLMLFLSLFDVISLCYIRRHAPIFFATPLMIA